MLRKLKSENYLEVTPAIEDQMYLRSYRLIHDGTAICLLVQHDVKGFYSFTFTTNGELTGVKYYEYGDMPEQSGEPAEVDPDIIR